MRRPRYETTEHTADLGLKAYGDTPKEAFENAAFGMFDIMVGPQGAGQTEKVEVSAEGDDAQGLLVAFLNELLFVFETQRLALRRFDIVEWDETTRLKAVARGSPLDPDEELGEPIKACTYHEVRVEKKPDGFEVEVLFDV